MDVKELIGQHKESVALVFKQLGINAPVTPKEVIHATLIYQGRFIDALADRIAIDNQEYTGFDFTTPGNFNSDALLKKIGAPQSGTATVFPANGTQFGQTQTLPSVTVKSKAAKKTLWDILDTVAGAAGSYFKAKGGNNTTAITYASPNDDTPKKTDKNKYFLIGGIVLVVLLVALVVSKKNK